MGERHDIPSRLRILWISHFVPYPPKGGVFQRGYHLIRRVGAAHDLHLVALRHKRSTHPASEVQSASRELSAFCRSVDIVDVSAATTAGGLLSRAAVSLVAGRALSVSVYASARVRAALRRRLDAYAVDVVHFDTIGLAQYLDVVGDLPRVVTHLGPEAFMIRRRIPYEGNPLKRAYFSYEWRALQRYEREMCRRFAINIVMSEDDARILKETAPDATFRVVANGVDPDYFVPVRSETSQRIVFAGRLDQYANRDGMLHFMKTAWPLIRAANPEATLDVIGMNPPRALLDDAARDPHVHVHGFVPDVRPFFQQAAIAICPVRDGGGTRLKVLDALAQGVPLVSTSIGCEGIAVVPERDLLIADTPQTFADQVSRLLHDRALRVRLSENGRRAIEMQYSWDYLATQLVECYRSAIAGRPASTAS